MVLYILELCTGQKSIYFKNHGTFLNLASFFNKHNLLKNKGQKMDAIIYLAELLQNQLNWNKQRTDFLAKFIITLIKVRTVNLAIIAESFPGNAKIESHYKREQRFFRNFKIDFTVIASFITSLLPNENGWILTLDRTDWKFGKTPVNILVLGIVYKGTAFPFLWVSLPKKGNSNTKERIELFKRFFECFGKERINYITCDREFIGEKWFKFLIENKIDFRIRVRENFLVPNRKGKNIAVKLLFQNLAIHQKRVLRKPYLICGHTLYISGMRLIDGEYLILVTPNFTPKSIEDYAKRWEIETLFGCLKTRGYNFEDTHLTMPDRIDKLLAILAIAFAWAHIVGEWLHEQKPLKIKNHGRLSKSIFRHGLSKLRNILANLDNKMDEFYFFCKFLSCT